MREDLERAIEIAANSAASGGGPFGAVLVLPDGRRFEAENRVTLDNDPTAHAEIMAIRAAAKEFGYDLSGSVLCSSCQPCPMCLTAALWARIDTIVYAATDVDAAAAGFDDRTFYEQLRNGITSVTSASVLALEVPSKLAPFQVWLANDSRTDY